MVLRCQGDAVVLSLVWWKCDGVGDGVVLAWCGGSVMVVKKGRVLHKLRGSRHVIRSSLDSRAKDLSFVHVLAQTPILHVLTQYLVVFSTLLLA